MTDVLKLCTQIKVENIEPNDTAFGQQNAGPREYPVMYSPIPNGILKEEPTSEEEGDECQLVAYPPLPQGVIKEESEVVDSRDVFIPTVKVISSPGTLYLLVVI